MSDRSSIEWTDATWNPIRARNLRTGGVGHFCVHVSEGCRNCYAARLQPWFLNPVRYAAQDLGKVRNFIDRDALRLPLRWRRPRTVFVCSMTDLSLESHPWEWVDEIFGVMEAAPQHSYQVLTKRPHRMRDYLNRQSGGGVPGAHVWLGVSAEDRRTAGAHSGPSGDTRRGAVPVGRAPPGTDRPVGMGSPA